MADDKSFDDSTPRAESDSQLGDSKKDTKGKKRSLFGLGKKKTADSSKPSSTSQPLTLSQDTSKLSSTSRSARSPTRVDYTPVSPSRALSSSPRVASPAGSQIFERDVQDETTLGPNSPAIPTHIQTENYIPPVLDDASEAITNNKLDPDTVEIVTHNSHQPASVTVTGTGTGASGTPFDQASGEWVDELASFDDRSPTSADNASNYGSLDSADVRRLSFISFADVVQSEHTGAMPGPGGSRESIHIAGLTSLPSAAMNRSPSPIRSPVSSQGAPGTSPPTSNPGSMKGVEMSPSRKPLGSPGLGGSHHGNLAPGDLNIQTMRQALRHTSSADLSNVRSGPTSPIDGPGSR